MARKTAVAGVPGLDPTLPNVPLVLNGTTWHLAFDFNSLATVGSLTGLNLLSKLDLQNLNAGEYRALLYSTLLKNHPDLTLEQAGSLINLASLPAITVALVHAWTGSQPAIIEGDKESINPPEEQLSQS